MKPHFFKTQTSFRTWLEKNHSKQTEFLVGFYKVNSGKSSMTWSESVDQALCFGWIDGVRRSIDEESYSIRFTPRKATSIWSAINIKKVKELTRKHLMKPSGLAAFDKRKDEKSKIYSHENKSSKLSETFEKKFIASKKAWTQFQTMPKSYQNSAIHWVMTAKQEATRESRLKTLIEDSKAGLKIKLLRR